MSSKEKMLDELDGTQNRHFATSPTQAVAGERSSSKQVASKSRRRLKKVDAVPAALAKKEASIEPQTTPIPSLGEIKTKNHMISPKKGLREAALQQEIREMNKEKSMHILESIKKQETKAEEKKANRLEQIMEKVKFQRNQYAGKKPQIALADGIPEAVVKRKPSKTDTAIDSVNHMSSVGGSEQANSKDETVGGSTNYMGSLYTGSNSLQVTPGFAPKAKLGRLESDNSRKIKGKLDEINESPLPSMNLRDKAQGISKVQFELSILKERKLLVSSADASGKLPKQKDQSFSIDVT